VWKQNGSGGLANGCASIPAVHVPEQSGQGGFLLMQARMFDRPCFSIACVWAEKVQLVSRKNPEVRGGVGIANQSGSIVSSHGPRHPTVLTPRGSLNRYHHGSPRRLLLRPSSTHGNPSRQTPSSSTESHHRRAFLFADPVRHRNSLFTHSPPQPSLPQGLS
jgi:hypothetical protein